MTFVLHYADLDLAAVAHRGQGRDRQLVAWHALRTADASGSGRVSQDQAVEVARWLRWRARPLGEVLESGAGIFWRLARDGTVYLRSAAQVAHALGVTAFRAAYRAPLRNLRGSLTIVRARLVLGAVAALRHGRPISNAAMAAMVGVDIRTVRRWRRTARVRARANYALVAPLRPGVVASDFRATGGRSLRTVHFQGRRWLACRIPDSFDTPRSGGVRSPLRRANRQLRTTSELRGGGHTRRCCDGTVRLDAPSDPSRTSLYTFEGHGRKAHVPVAVWSPVLPQESGGHFPRGLDHE